MDFQNSANNVDQKNKKLLPKSVYVNQLSTKKKNPFHTYSHLPSNYFQLKADRLPREQTVWWHIHPPIAKILKPFN